MDILAFFADNALLTFLGVIIVLKLITLKKKSSRHQNQAKPKAIDLGNVSSDFKFVGRSASNHDPFDHTGKYDK